MFCYKCGNPIKDGVNFCSKCGTKVRAQTTAPASVSTVRNPAGAAVNPAEAAANPAQSGTRLPRMGRVLPVGYMDIGNPVKKPKVSAYTVLPHTEKMLPFHELFDSTTKNSLILGQDQMYYWVNSVMMCAMTEDSIFYRFLSEEEQNTLGTEKRKLTFLESVGDLIDTDLMISAGAYSSDTFEPPKSDNTLYTYVEFQHIKKIKPSPERTYIRFMGMFGNTISVLPQYYDFFYAYVSARI